MFEKMCGRPFEFCLDRLIVVCHAVFFIAREGKRVINMAN